MRIEIIVSARPNFVKAAPLVHAFRAAGLETALVHAGQHFEPAMSAEFFDLLELPQPEINLGVSGGSHAEQTARMLIAFEQLHLETMPAWTIVVGDVNATMAATLAVKKVGGRVGHVEAGLRSFDMSMPEEVNRVVVDRLADRLWAPSQDAVDNLLAEGRTAQDIALVGNVMIDSLKRLTPKIAASTKLDELAVAPQGYVLASLHRPQNVDAPEALMASLHALEGLSDFAPVLLPLHPRTRERLAEAAVDLDSFNIRFLPPMDYIAFGKLQRDAKLVVTDSGGVQEETSYLGVPCLTLRPNTERPVTLQFGTNRLTSVKTLKRDAKAALLNPSLGNAIPLWDGQSAHRIAEDLLSL